MKKIFGFLFGFIVLVLTTGGVARFPTIATAQGTPVTFSTPVISDTSATISGYLANLSIPSISLLYTNSVNGSTQEESILFDPMGGKFSKEITGLQPATKYTYQIINATTRETLTKNLSFTTKSAIYGFTINSVTETSAILFGQVTTTNPDIAILWGEKEVSQYQNRLIPTVTGNKKFSSKLSNLLPNTEYKVLLVKGSSETSILGGPYGFKTLSIIAAPYATNIKDTTVTIGTRLPKGLKGVAVYYGLKSNALANESLMTESSSGVYTTTLQNLNPSTEYFYKVVGRDDTGAPIAYGSTTVIGTDTSGNPLYLGSIFSFQTQAKQKVIATPGIGGGQESYSLSAPVAISKTSDGYTAQAVVVVNNPVRDTNYRIGLGKSTTGASTCNFDSQYMSDGKYTGGETALAINKTWKLPEGVYCLGVQKETAVVSNTYTTVVPLLTTFTVGGTSVNPGATDGPKPNEFGCVSNGTNEYCPLAILPGIGEAGTGKISFTECYIDGVKVVGKSGFGCYLNNFIRIIIGLIGVLSVVMIIVGGIEYWSTTSGTEKGTAKARILAALMGVILALGSYVILRTLNKNLVNLEVKVPSVELTLEDAFVRTSGGGTYTGGGGNPNVTKNITTFDSMLAASAAKNKVNCTFLKADMYAESGGNPNATSPVGARGLMQLMPATFSGLMPGPANIMDPATNIEAGARYFAKLQGTACNGKPSNTVCTVAQQQFIIASYNGGPKSNSESEKCPGKTWWQCEQNSGYAETRAYVLKVQKNYDKLIQEKWGC